MPKILERDIERYLIAQMKKIGGKAYKWNSANLRGVPDRICCFPNGVTVFVEVKAPHGKLSMLQTKVLQELGEMAQKTDVVYTKNEVDMLISIYT